MAASQKSNSVTNSLPREPAWTAQFLRHDTPASLTVGESVTVNLWLKNIGSAVWPNRGSSAVQVGYRWIGADGKQRLDVDDHRTGLPHEIAANEEIAVGVTLVAPKTPGNYRLRWDLMLGGDTWFSDRGKSALVVPISVTVLPTDVTGWRVESNMNPAQVALALDGDAQTFWDSGEPQSARQWFRLNLSVPRLIDGIQFLSPGKGFPESYCLYVSADGQDWIEVKRVESENKYDVTAILAPQWVQYVQMDVLANAPASWMISEILVHPATQWKVKASHNSDAAPNAIDNRSNTEWMSQEPQASGMWYQIDLGREEIVTGIKLIGSSRGNPESYRITTWNASARRWQLAYDEMENHADVDVMFTPTQTQFINFQLLQASAKPWTIQQVQIDRGMESWLGPSM